MKKYKRLISIVLVVLLALTVLSCGKKTTEPDIDETEPVVAEETVVVPPETSETIIEVTDEQIVLPSDADPEMYQVGSVLAAAPTDVAPHGFLRIVSSYQVVGEQIVVNTQPARLEDAFEQLDFHVVQDLRTTDIETSNSLIDGVTFIEETRNPYDFYYRIDEDFYLDDNVILNVNGGLSLTLGYELLVKVNVLRGLHYIKAGSFITSNGDLELNVTGRFGYEKTIKLVEHYFVPVTFFVGAVPIVITPKVVVVLEIDANGRAHATVSASASASLEAGLVYADKEWSPYYSRDLNFDYSPPTLEASMEATISAGPIFEINIYDLAGPYAYGRAWLNFGANINEVPWWILKGGYTVDAGVKFEAIGYKANYSVDDIIHYSTVIAQAPNQCVTPSFSPPGGSYNTPQTVSISCVTSGATIHYTTDGSYPTSSSLVYSNPINVDRDTTIKAKAFKSGWDDSDIATAEYVISTDDIVATPSFSPPGGSYSTAQNVSITCATSGATIRYTTNGSDPTSSSAIYSDPINVSQNTTIKAQAFKSGWDNSDIATAEYIISTDDVVATPVFIPPGGSYSTAQNVSITCATSGATIRYTIDGEDPTSSSAVYSSPIKVSQDTTIKAQAFKSGLDDSNIATAEYIISPDDIVDIPTFTPPGDSYYSAQAVTILCTTSGATIYYTTDGSDPTESSLKYTKPIRVLYTTTIKARAYKTDWGPSAVATATYNINIASVEMIKVTGGTFTMGRTKGDGNTDELPTHSVTLNSFYLGKYQVTQSEYEAITGDRGGSSAGIGPNYPVYSVNWYGAIRYCNLRSMAEGLNPAYTIKGSTDPADWGAVPGNNNSTWNAAICDWNVNGYRLPTEAEWEYAARGGTNNPDYLYSGSDDIDEVAWYRDNSSGNTHPVGGKAPNGLGIYDMSGNVWEWCWDWYDSYSNFPANNPRGPASGSNRLLRGGNWYNDADHCRVAYRYDSNPNYSSINIGFRLCRTFP